jgi:hypothetical protein
MRFSTLSDRARDWRLALIAINVALPSALAALVRPVPQPGRGWAFLAALLLLLGLNARLAGPRQARPWAVLCVMLTLVSGLVFGSLSWIATAGYLPALLVFTPPP